LLGGFESDDEDLKRLLDGFIGTPRAGEQAVELGEGANSAAEITKLQEGSEGLAVVALGVRQPSLLLGEDAKVVVGAGSVVTVTELQVDGEGLAVVALGVRQPSLLLGGPSELPVTPRRGVQRP
jgi:hypothetical protein